MALALAMQLLGLFERGDARLQQSLSWILSDSFQTAVSEPVLFMVAAMFSFGIAFAVLDSPAAWRRIVLGLTALVLVLAMVPVCALWQIYFSPFFVVVAYFWAWFCTMMYTSQHVMPCEIGVAEKTHQPHAGSSCEAGESISRLRQRRLPARVFRRGRESSGGKA